jgi:nucleoid-associated protein YgaU
MGLRLEEKFLFDNTSWEFLKKYTTQKKFVLQYATQILSYPTQQQINQITSYEFRTWGAGDTYAKLANEYYGDPELWWVLAWINKKPTEFQLSRGDVLYVPLVLREALALVGIE